MSPLGDSITETNEALEMESSNKTANSLINVNEDDGIFLTWKDLTVTIVSNGKKGCSSILEDLTGYAKPGHLLAIMGPSGSGKTTLLDALAGRLGSDTRQTGKILINGHKKALAYGTSAYVTQDDTLITTLTVKEAVYYSAQLQLPDTMPKSDKKERAEVTIREMGLQDAMNTRIRRLSGGQKRRVSISIDILTRPKLLFLDEPTSGLDSAASYYVMSRIAKLGQRDGIGRTIIASIHQPSSEVFQLFHNLCLLSAGQTVYFGPATAANEFFAFNGFPCPTHQNPSDHFLKTINKDFQKEAEEGLADGEIPTEEVINILKRSYKSCGIYEQVGSQVAEICKQARGSLLMFVASFITFMTIGGFPSFVEDMKVFERERLNGHYGATAFVVGNSFSAVPYLIIISLVPGAIVYYLPGLHKGYQHFFYFVLLLFACMMLVESLMMIVASLVPNYLLGIITGSGIQGMMILGGGFFQLPNDIPKIFWKYPLYYIVFHKYAYQGMFKNEFEGLKFDNNQDGEQILRDTWQLELGYSKWVDLAILFGMVVVYRLVFLGIIKATEKLKPVVKAFMAVPPKPTTQIIENLEAVAYLPEVKV
ncbi:hypothetical protein KPL70_023339 [Citrus sinensis]|nr:hypothetical protein KPL70_023339 [Citrus sinensis]